MSKKIAIVGAGLIGTSTALRLRQKGLDVILIDRSFTEQPTSGGNAGIIAYSDIFPMVTAKALLKIPFWLMDPRAMISLRPTYALNMLPWFIEMVKSTTAARKKAYVISKVSLMRTALGDHYDQIDKADHQKFIAETGTHYIYSSEKRFNEDEELRTVRAEHGYESEILSAPESFKRIEGLEAGVYKAVFEKDSACLKSPMGLLKYLRDKAVALGVELKEAKVNNVRRGSDAIYLDLDDKDPLEVDEIVIAAGAFSRKLVADLGFNIPLDTERGYNVTIENPPFKFNTSVIAKDAQIAISSLDDGLRVGGGVEFAGIDAAPDYSRVDKMLVLAKEMFPSIPTDRGVRWMGCRPSMPDNLPVIGQHPRDNRVSFAFGHGHLGMTMAAVTAKHITNMIVDSKTDIDLSPFSVDRFV